MASAPKAVVGSGNVVADLGRARPEEVLAKTELAHKIAEIIERRQLTQAEAAVLLRVDQPKISALTRGRLASFSLDRSFGLSRTYLTNHQDKRTTSPTAFRPMPTS